MEEFNHFGFSSTNIHQHLPIRRFSQAARVEEHHQFLSDDHNSSWELLHHLDDQVYPPEMAPASADSMEEFQFVDSFFNIENIYNEDSSYNNSFFPEVVLDDTFLIPDDNGDFPMMIDMSMSSSCEDATPSTQFSPRFGTSLTLLVIPCKSYHIVLQLG